MSTLRRAIIGFVLACMALASPARGESEGRLRWDDCGLAGNDLRVFACDTDAGSSDLFVSCVAPNGVTQLTGAEVSIDFIAETPTMPTWWEMFFPGACRTGALSTSFAPLSGGNPACLDHWQGDAAGGVARYGIGSMGGLQYPPNWGQLTAAVGLHPDLATSVEPDSEYFVMRIRIAHSQSSGASTCTGCGVALCLRLRRLVLTQPVGVGDFSLQTAGPLGYVQWQVPHGGFPTGCYTSTHNRTWGAIKSLYR